MVNSHSLSLSGHTSYFLATTALEEFWDTSKPLIFLGEWCRRHSRKQIWDPLGGEILANPWQDRAEVTAANSYVCKVYEQLLPSIATAFNQLHGTAHSERYWRILLGPWLLYFIPIVYDRLKYIQAALQRYPGITTVGLAEESFVSPKDTMDYVFLTSDDGYNLQLFTQILMFLDCDFPKRPLEVVANPTVLTTGSSSLNVRIKTLLRSLWKQLEENFQEGRPLVLKSSYFPRSFEFCLILRALGAVWPNNGGICEIAPAQVDLSAREKLKSFIADYDQFTSLLKWLLPSSVPVSFVEGFKAVTEFAAENYPSPPKAIFSANACYYDEAFKQWTAQCVEQGTLLLGTQHGGNYGSVSIIPSEDHETAIADRYYSWGWERQDCRATVIPMPASKLAGRKPIGFEAENEGCLYVGTAMARYLIQFPYTPSDFANYLLWQERFLDRLTPETKDVLRVRLHYADYGWDIAERWRQRYPDVTMDSWNVPFIESLRRCRIYICDHLSTTFIESLALDKPSILFWDPVVNELRKEAQPYYDLLRNAGILHETAESAADAVSLHYNDVGNWWNSPDCQAARRQFCNRFGRTSIGPTRDWSNEFRNVARSSNRGSVMVNN